MKERREVSSEIYAQRGATKHEKHDRRGRGREREVRGQREKVTKY